MPEVKLQTLKLKFKGDFQVLTVSVQSEKLTVTIGTFEEERIRYISDTWSHTVFELEKLSMGLSYVARGKLPFYLNVPSRDMLFGPKVGLTPALWFQLGHPGIGESGHGVCLSAYLKESIRNLPPEFRLDVACEGKAEHGTFLIEDVKVFAEELYQMAKLLDPILCPREFLDDLDEPELPDHSSDHP